MTKIEEVAAAIGNAPWLFIRTNKECTDGLPHEICRHGSEEEDEIVIVARCRFHEHAESYRAKLMTWYQAKAAINALREPTIAMSNAGGDVECHTDFDEEGRLVSGAAKDVWLAMVDALLAEKP